jgi:hypothetical protein
VGDLRVSDTLPGVLPQIDDYKFVESGTGRSEATWGAVYRKDGEQSNTESDKFFNFAWGNRHGNATDFMFDQEAYNRLANEVKESAYVEGERAPMLTRDAGEAERRRLFLGVDARDCTHQPTPANEQERPYFSSDETPYAYSEGESKLRTHMTCNVTCLTGYTPLA